jgi:hypothetical protein
MQKCECADATLRCEGAKVSHCCLRFRTNLPDMTLAYGVGNFLIDWSHCCTKTYSVQDTNPMQTETAEGA